MVKYSDRERIEEAFEATTAKCRLVTENIPVVVYSVLPDEHSANPFVSGRVLERTLQDTRSFTLREGLEHLGGRMEIVSQPGRGARITLIAPLKPPEAGGGDFAI